MVSMGHISSVPTALILVKDESQVNGQRTEITEVSNDEAETGSEQAGSLLKTTTGVYFDNVEVRHPMHPLQAHLKLSRTEKPGKGSDIGRPLLPAPTLPSGLQGQNIAPLKTRTLSRFLRSAKVAMDVSPQARTIISNVSDVGGWRRGRMSKDEKLFVEAATALSESAR